MRLRPLTTWLLILPALALAGWALYEQLPLLLSPVPPWLQPSNPDAVPGACEALASLQARHGGFSSNLYEAAILPAESRILTDRAITTYYNLPPGRYALDEGPALVEAAFGERGRRLAWLNIADIGEPGTRLDKAAVVYVDAQSGDILGVAAVAAAVDPQTTCGSQPVGRRALVRRFLPLLLLVGYLLLTAVGVLMTRLRRTLKPATS